MRKVQDWQFGFASMLVVLIGLTSLHGQTKPNTATQPSRRSDEASVKRHESFVERAKKGGVDVLFIGDSITQGWETVGKKTWQERFTKWNPANFGISGDRTQHVLWRITEGKELQGIDPKLVVLMIGTNNISSNSAAEIAEGITSIVVELRHQKPNTKVLVLGVFPRSDKAPKESKVAAPAELQPKVKELNSLLADLANKKTVFFLDIGDKFLDATGGLSRTVMSDYLHLSQEGYRTWADAIESKVTELIK